MGFSSVVQWWEEWQLRILVLGSLTVQCFLAVFARARKKHIRPLARFAIWLSYLGSDALAIYALATVFNRRRKVQHATSGDLEVLWTSVLLMHLGGQVTITAYNIEDNELWRRHIVTAASQVTVALYVFCKAWSGSGSADKRLLAATILLFIPGIFKCFEKPMVLKNASFNSLLVNPFFAQGRKTSLTAKREVDLEEYIQSARDYVRCNKDPPALYVEDYLDSRAHLRVLRPYIQLFIDVTPTYIDRFTIFKFFWLFDDEQAYKALRVKWDWPDTVPQHSLIGFFVRNKRRTCLMRILGCLQLRGFYDKYWCTCNSSGDITSLLRAHVKDGWLDYISDAETYRAFSDSRGHRILQGTTGCGEFLTESIEKPFDESIILWHVATDFCFHRKGASAGNEECGRVCREISNYMMHLLFAEPEMLMPGCRRNLFAVAFRRIEKVLRREDRLLLEVADEKELTQKIIDKMDFASRQLSKGESFIHDAFALFQELTQLGDETRMWEVIRGVWVEMLCFSAGRCRGFLHAKSLGSGGEYLSFVSLLMSYAGLETFADRQQRVHLRLSKEERINIARQRRTIELLVNTYTGKKAPSDQASTSRCSSTPQAAATRSASEFNVPLHEEEEDDAIVIVVSP